MFNCTAQKIQENELAEEILENHSELFTQRKYEKITEKLNCERISSKSYYSNLKLNPHPGDGFEYLKKILLSQIYV